MNNENWRGSLYEVFEDPVSYDSDCSILSDESDMLIADNCTFAEEIDRVLSNTILSTKRFVTMKNRD